MGEVLKQRSVKWGEAEERMVAEIQADAQPFEVSRAQVVRVAIRRLHIVICMPGSVGQDEAPKQELQGVTRCYQTGLPGPRQGEPGRSVRRRKTA
jgi:hypothetical protein